MNSNPVKSWASGTPSGASGSFGPASTATTPKIATNVKIPMGAGVGAAVTATLTAVVPKAALAKAAVAMVRANPYLSTALTVGWLANAGYQYFKDTDTFSSAPPSTVLPLKIYNMTPGVASPQYSRSDAISACKVAAANGANCMNGFPKYCANGDPSVIVSGDTEYYAFPSPTAYGSETSTYFRATISNSTNCPSGYSYNSGTCNLNPGAPLVTKTPEEAEAAINQTPLSGTSDTASKFDDELSELVRSGYYPDTDGNVPTLTGPTTAVQGQNSTTVSPDGDVTTVNNTFTNTYNQNYVETSQVTTTTTTPVTGLPSTTTTTQSPNTEATPKEQLTDCEKFPNSIGCSNYGDIPVAEVLPVTVLPATFSYTSWGSGSCPASQIVHGITFNYTPYCEKFVMLKPVILVLGLIASLFIVIGPVRET